ncbi:MAG: response regulator, partial [Acidobacteria bacterium]
MAKTILLADDSVTIQKVVELTFMDQEVNVEAVGSGDEALERLASLAPDLVIADVHMPGADGYEVCRRAKEARPGMPVLLLVGTFEPFDEAQAAACGADGHLKKPFDSQDLLRLVEELTSAPPAAEPAPPQTPSTEPMAVAAAPEPAA